MPKPSNGLAVGNHFRGKESRQLLEPVPLDDVLQVVQIERRGKSEMGLCVVGPGGGGDVESPCPELIEELRIVEIVKLGEHVVTRIAI